jgi:hypothetical protein
LEYTYIQVKLTNIFYIETLFKNRFIQDSGVFRDWLRQVSLYIAITWRPSYIRLSAHKHFNCNLIRYLAIYLLKLFFVMLSICDILPLPHSNFGHVDVF